MSTDRNPEKKLDFLVREFLLSQIPNEILWVYRIVAGLKFPIVDPAALRGQVNEHLDPKEAGVVAEFFDDAFLVSDFPLDEARRTLETLIMRLQAFIPWLTTPLVPIGIGLGGDRADDFSGQEPCQQAVRPFYEYCYNIASGASPEIQRLEQLACHGRALRAVIQCNEKLRRIGISGIRARSNPCGRRALQAYADCVVDRVLNNEDPEVCIGTYKANIYRCRLPYIYR